MTPEPVGDRGRRTRSASVWLGGSLLPQLFGLGSISAVDDGPVSSWRTDLTQGVRGSGRIIDTRATAHGPRRR